MSRRRRALRSGGAPREPERTAAADMRRSRPRDLLRHPLARVGLAVLVIGAITLIALDRWRSRPLPPFPPPATASTEDGPVFDDFAGATSCRSCHEAQHDAWRTSTHGRAGGMPRDGVVLPEFTRVAIRFADGVVVPESDGAGGLRFVIRQDARAPITMRVDAVVGGAHMVGGGTQAYFTRHEDGTLRMLPWELTGDGVWFCNTATRADLGWQPITPQLRLADCGDWPPRRVLGHHDRLASCQECHGSQIQGASAGQPTRWQSLAIDCEACHGPARRHAESGGRDAVPASLDVLAKEASVQLCLRCHGLKDALQPGYLAGRRLEVHYSGGLATASGDAIFADGRTRTFAYQEGHLFSPCYLNGGMTCVDCHAPHDQSYRSFQREPLPGRVDDRQCTGCHPSKAERPELHTRHAPDSPGSRCVACHMPYLQQPDVGTAIRYGRSDHTIAIPRPALDSVLGVRGACAACHADMSNTRLAGLIDTWHAPVKPVAAPVAALVEDTPGDLAPLLDRAGQHPAATLALLGRELRRAPVRSGGLDRDEQRALERLLAASDPDLAAAAAALLHYLHGDDRRVRLRLIDALTAHAEPQLLRARWVALLGWVGDTQAGEGRDDRATRAYAYALELRPQDAALLRNLGYAYLRQGQNEDALAAFRSAVRAAPNDALAHIALGIAHGAGGNEAAAAAAYADALRADPYEPLAHFNLGNVALRAGRTDEAVRHYERALALDAALAQAHFNLARARIARDELPQAAAALRAGLEFQHDDAAAQALAQIEADIRSSSGAARQ